MSVLIPRSVLVAASKVIRTILGESNTCLHEDIHVSLAGTDGVTLIKFAEIMNCSHKKTFSITPGTDADNLADLLRQLDCNVLQCISHSSNPSTNSETAPKSSQSTERGAKRSEDDTLNIQIDDPSPEVCEMRKVFMNAVPSLNERVSFSPTVTSTPMKSSISKVPPNIINKVNNKIKIKLSKKTNTANSNTINSNGQRYECLPCKRIFAQKRYLARHKKTSCKFTDNGSFQASEKNMKFNEAEVNVHVSSSTNDVATPIKTEMIDSGYNDVLHEAEAGYDHDNDVELLAFACPICSREFRRLADLKDHVGTNHPETFKFQCKHCHMQFNHKRNLNAHVKRKHKEVIDNPMNLEQKKAGHLEDHVGSQPKEADTKSKKYRCNFCSKLYLNKKSLQVHVCQKHKNKRKDDYQNKNVDSDVAEDPNLKNFDCNLCDKTFAHERSLKHHMKVIHKPEAEASNMTDEAADFPSGLHYCCQTCQGIFGEDELEGHMKETGHKEATKFRYPKNFPGWKNN